MNKTVNYASTKIICCNLTIFFRNCDINIIHNYVHYFSRSLHRILGKLQTVPKTLLQQVVDEQSTKTKYCPPKKPDSIHSRPNLKSVEFAEQKFIRLVSISAKSVPTKKESVACVV